MTTKASPTERLSIGQKKPIDAAKELVSILEAAERICEGGVQKQGGGYVARCPIPTHPDNNPSCRINPEKGVWYCDPCSEGGNVVTMARVAWGYGDSGREAAMAAANLLHEFGHEIPQRPPSWFARQERQKPVRDALEETRVRSVHRRLYRIFVRNTISLIEDEDERREEGRAIWDELLPIARMLVSRDGWA